MKLNLKGNAVLNENVMWLRPVSVFAICVILAGCSSSGGGGAAEPDFGEGITDFLRLNAEFDVNSRTYSETLPASGSVQYTGYSSLRVAGEFENQPRVNILIGDVVVDADFDRSELSGEMSNFVDFEDRAYSGSIDLETASIPTTRYPYVDGDTSGTLAHPDTGEMTFDGYYYVDFFGDNGEWIYAEGAGDVVADNGAASGNFEVIGVGTVPEQ